VAFHDAYGLSLNCGRAGNTLNVQGTPAVAGGFFLNAGSGDDVITVGSPAGSLDAIQGPVFLDGEGGTNQLTLNDQGSSAAQSWTVTPTSVTRGAAFVSYVNISTVTLQGGSGGTTFNLAGSAAGTSVTVQAGAGPTTLVGSDPDNTWLLSGSNAGTVSGPAYGGLVQFIAPTNQTLNLVGGAGNDTFVFQGPGVTGSIDGAGGMNTLDYSAYSTTVIVDLQTNTGTGVGGSVLNIQNVIGGTGGGAGVYNILVGNGGNVLTGGDGRRNLLIAGGAASTLIGGNDDDILIGGTTAYDTEAGLTSLRAIMAYWSGTADDYATRVANLLSGNGVPLLDASVVSSNGGGNTMLGNHGGASELNLFYGADPTQEITDYNPQIGEQFINR
jgi:hypothetical protein